MRREWICADRLASDSKAIRPPALNHKWPRMEAAGIAPASREASARASTCVADHLIVGLGAPVGRVPFGLSRHEFNPSRNRRLGSGDPELASPAASLGRRHGARPLLFFRQRDGGPTLLLAVKVLVGFLRGPLTNLGTPPVTSDIRSILVRPHSRGHT